MTSPLSAPSRTMESDAPMPRTTKRVRMAEESEGGEGGEGGWLIQEARIRSLYSRLSSNVSTPSTARGEEGPPARAHKGGAMRPVA